MASSPGTGTRGSRTQFFKPAFAFQHACCFDAVQEREQLLLEPSQLRACLAESPISIRQLAHFGEAFGGRADVPWSALAAIGENDTGVPSGGSSSCRCGRSRCFVYAMRRVDCPACGVKVEQVPWCDGKNQLTTTYRWFLAGWAKRLSWKGVAEAFGTTWQNVFRSVKHAVSWGLAHRTGGIESIGVDEVQWQRGHKYLTLVYQIDAGCKRLLWIGGTARPRRSAVLPDVGQGALEAAEVRVQRHVEGVSEGDRQEGGPRRFTCWTGFTSCRR
jgi:hypothetical protein